MSTINIAVKTLLSHAPLVAQVGQRVYPIAVPQNAVLPYCVVHQISESEEDMLQGASQLRDGRVSIETVTGSTATVGAIGELVIDAMRDRVEFPIASCIATTRKAETDETQASDQFGANNQPTASRRITDFYIFWRKAP